MNNRLQPGELLRHCKNNAQGLSLADYAGLCGQEPLSNALRGKEYRIFKPVFFSAEKEQFPRQQPLQPVGKGSIRRNGDEAKPNKTSVKRRNGISTLEL